MCRGEDWETSLGLGTQACTHPRTHTCTHTHTFCFTRNTEEGKGGKGRGQGEKPVLSLWVFMGLKLYSQGAACDLLPDGVIGREMEE